MGRLMEPGDLPMEDTTTNETIRGGWLEWLRTIKLQRGAAFDREAEQRRQKRDAADTVVAKRLQQLESALHAALSRELRPLSRTHERDKELTRNRRGCCGGVHVLNSLSIRA